MRVRVATGNLTLEQHAVDEVCKSHSEDLQ